MNSPFITPPQPQTVPVETAPQPVAQTEAAPLLIEEPSTDPVSAADLEPVTNVINSITYRREPEKGFDATGATETIFMPAATSQGVVDRIRDLPKTNLESGDTGRQWLGAVKAGMESCVAGNALVNTINDEEAVWAHGVTSESGELRSGQVNFKAKPGQALSPDKLRERVRKSLKLGGITNVALWHSGFWVRIQAPSEAALLELYRTITAEKVSLGRSTYGLLFSNLSSHTTRVLLDFCVEHIYETSLALPEEDDVRKYIRTTDLQTLFWGLACSVWSNGVQYTRACIADPSKCKHVVQELIDLEGLQRVNTKQLTAWQIRHMTKRQRNTMSLDDLARYVSEFTKGQPRRIELSEDEGVAMTLRVPTSLEHVEAGYRWISAIEETYGRAMTLDAKQRDEYLMHQGRATLMRNYAHFVQSLEVDGQTYEDTELIENILEDLTASDDIRRKFGQEVAKYIDESTIALIAIEAYDCPSCGAPQRSPVEKNKFPNLIPLDITQHFFQLLLQRLRKIELR